MGIHHRYCLACDTKPASKNKEHFWPRWLVKLTRTRSTGVKWSGRRISPESAKVPLCSKCNTDFGRYLEEPARLAFLDLENRRGISDEQAEILVRWLWKFVGLAYRMHHPIGQYTERYTVRDRVLRPIDEAREHISLAVSLIETIEPEYGDAPMGIDTAEASISGICVGGVFSRVVLAVVERDLEALLDPSKFSFYRFGRRGAPLDQAKLFHPRAGFTTCTEAVGYMASGGPLLSRAHDTRMVARSRNRTW